MQTLNQVDEPIRPAKGISDSSHYYEYANGVWLPLYTPEKNYTLREARKDQKAGRIVVPSVTTIFKVLAKPSLERWKAEQVAKACWDQHENGFNIGQEYTSDEWMDAAIDTASNASRGAMDLGTRIHAAIESAIAGKDWDADLDVYVRPVLNKRAELGVKESIQEQCVGSVRYGFAGRGDDRSDSTMTFRDYKSRKSKNGKVPVYETDFAQLAAYSFATWGNDFFKRGSAEVWGISTSEPSLLTVTSKSGPELVEDFQCFLALNTVWSHMNGFKAGRAA